MVILSREQSSVRWRELLSAYGTGPVVLREGERKRRREYWRETGRVEGERFAAQQQATKTMLTVLITKEPGMHAPGSCD